MTDPTDSDEQRYAEMLANGTVNLIVAELRRMGFDGPIPTYAELVASGALKASECKITSLDMVTPGWDSRHRQ